MRLVPLAAPGCAPHHRIPLSLKAFESTAESAAGRIEVNGGPNSVTPLARFSSGGMLARSGRRSGCAPKREEIHGQPR